MNKRQWLHFFIILTAMLLIVLAVRLLGISTYKVTGEGLQPAIKKGETVVVNRWSYGLRSGGWLFGYDRWMPKKAEKGDVIAYSNPLENQKGQGHTTYLGLIEHGPGDIVSIDGVTLTIPFEDATIAVTPDNMTLLCNTYRLYEGRKAEIRDSMLYIDGQQADCASFKYNYYWVSSGNADNIMDSRYFGLIPESLIIGKVIYHADLALFNFERWKQYWHQLFSDLYNGSRNSIATSKSA